MSTRPGVYHIMEVMCQHCGAGVLTGTAMNAQERSAWMLHMSTPTLANWASVTLVRRGVHTLEYSYCHPLLVYTMAFIRCDFPANEYLKYTGIPHMCNGLPKERCRGTSLTCQTSIIDTSSPSLDLHIPGCLPCITGVSCCMKHTNAQRLYNGEFYK